MKLLKTLFNRVTFMVLMVLLELGLVLSIFHWFHTQAAWIEAVLRILSVLIVLTIVNTSRHLSSDMMWILLIILFPVFGTALYLLLGANLLSSKTYKNIVKKTGDDASLYEQDPDVQAHVEQEDNSLRGQFHYIWNHAGYPFYENSHVDYYPLGDSGFPVMLEELRKAEKFILLEYFIVEEGEMWNQIVDILKRKAEQGLDVRVLYDDMGSFMTLPWKYSRTLEEQGIKCIPFNRINPIIGIIMNHRDHRKIMVIDGKVGFSGGVNLADEYINVKVKHGHWKDNVIRVTGDAVWSLTVMFLTHWNALRPTDEDYTVFKNNVPMASDGGYIAPYADTPLDNELDAQSVYMNILNSAGRYCYIMTPYLIIDSDMEEALELAAKRGVDVRIITPGVPDKKLVWNITRSYYRKLIESGVKIYEYTPGFVHAKVFVSDDICATVGTVNLDYRSLYLHFENGVYMYRTSTVEDIHKDFEEVNSLSREIPLSEARKGLFFEFFIAVVRLFAPLL